MQQLGDAVPGPQQVSPSVGSQYMLGLGPQLPTQVPAAQLAPTAQGAPQLPQFAGSVWVFTHVKTPFTVQQVSPAAQVTPPQVTPALQVPAVQLSPAAQAWPQDPQLLLSVRVSAHVPPQHACPAASHGTPPQVQAPATQVSPAAQACPHDPQFSGSFEVSRHVETPFAVQQSYPAGQPAISQSVHLPFTQLPDGQSFPHSPQFAGSFEVSRHVPPQQVGAPAGQAFPHSPQFLES